MSYIDDYLKDATSEVPSKEVSSSNTSNKGSKSYIDDYLNEGTAPVSSQPNIPALMQPQKSPWYHFGMTPDKAELPEKGHIIPPMFDKIGRNPCSSSAGSPVPST